MFEKYNQFAQSLSAPSACSHCGQATPHHNYYPHFAAIAVISSVATMLAFAVPLLIWAQTGDFGNQLPMPINDQANQMNPGNFQGQPNNFNGPMNQPNQPPREPNQPNQPMMNNQPNQMNPGNFQPGPNDQPNQFRQFNQVDPMSLGPISEPTNNQNQPFDQSSMNGNGFQPNSMGNQPGATCRINGQEQPGPCPQFNSDQPNNFNQEQNDQERQAMDARQQAQRLKDMKRGALDMQRGLKMFKTQIAKITKQGLTIPEEITANLTKAQELIDKINTAKSSDELEDFDMSEVGEVMQSLNESRGQLQTMAQLPSILKQMKSEIKRQTADLARANKLAANLNKKGLDVSQHLTNFTEQLAQLKNLYDEVTQKSQSGNIEEDLMSTIGEDFFGQIQEAYQPYKTIQIISNLGTFKANFKLQLSQAANQIKQVERKKLDATELKSLYDQAKERGNEIIATLKTPDLDPENIMTSLDELQQIQQDFRDQVDELLGNSSLPVSSGPKLQMPQFNAAAWGQTESMNNPSIIQINP